MSLDFVGIAPQESIEPPVKRLEMHISPAHEGKAIVQGRGGRPVSRIWRHAREGSPLLLAALGVPSSVCGRCQVPTMPDGLDLRSATRIGLETLTGLARGGWAKARQMALRKASSLDSESATSGPVSPVMPQPAL